MKKLLFLIFVGLIIFISGCVNQTTTSEFKIDLSGQGPLWQISYNSEKDESTEFIFIDGWVDFDDIRERLENYKISIEVYDLNNVMIKSSSILLVKEANHGSADFYFSGLEIRKESGEKEWSSNCDCFAILKLLDENDDVIVTERVTEIKNVAQLI